VEGSSAGVETLVPKAHSQTTRSVAPNDQPPALENAACRIDEFAASLHRSIAPSLHR